MTKVEFKHVFDKATKINQKNVSLLYRPNQKDYARMGVIVAKHVAKSAVARNRIKRVIRESFRHHQKTLGGIDIVIIARRNCSTLSKAELRKGIDELWARLLKYLSR